MADCAGRLVRAWVVQRSVADCLRLLNAIDVPCAKVQRIDEVLADPQIIARGMLIEQEHPLLGTNKLPNLPYRLSDWGVTAASTMPTPFLGQHNRTIAAQLSHSPAEIEQLCADGVLYAESTGA